MAKKLTEIRPRFSRIDFFRLRGEEFLEALFRYLDQELGEKRQRAKRWAKLNLHQLILPRRERTSPTRSVSEGYPRSRFGLVGRKELAEYRVDP